MVESSDLQAAIQRTQQTERIQQLQSHQEEANRKRFELEMARERAEKEKKVTDSPRAEEKRVIRDKYEGEESEHERQDAEPPEKENPEQQGRQEEKPASQDSGPDDRGERLDVRV
jgi:hypothetical protein